MSMRNESIEIGICNAAKVSVCVPVYKVEPYIEKCARALMEQTLESLELIFIDDGSPDGSFKLLQRVLAEYPARAGKVKILRHAASRGSAATRREALLAARGEFVGFCDSDDWIDPEYYARMIAAAEATGADLVYAPIVREFPDGRSSRIENPPCGTAEEYLTRCCPGDGFNSMVNKIIRREIAQAEDIRLADGVRLGEDLLYTAQVMKRCARLASVSDVVYHYRQNAASITGEGIGKKRPEDLRCVCEILETELIGPKFASVRDRLRRDVLTAAIKARVFKDPVYRDVRRRLEGPLLGDKRHGLVKKSLLALVNLLAWRGK